MELSEYAENIVFQLRRQGRFGKNIIREDDIRPKRLPNKVFKSVLKELLESELLKKKKGLGTNTYSLNPHKSREIQNIYDRRKQLRLVGL